jgi:hypothetical protein
VKLYFLPDMGTTTSRLHWIESKNNLFAGHDDGAINWACLASLISRPPSFTASTLRPILPISSPSTSMAGPSGNSTLRPYTLIRRDNAVVEGQGRGAARDRDCRTQSTVKVIVLAGPLQPLDGDATTCLIDASFVGVIGAS